MKAESYKCEMCPAIKQDANHWFVGFLRDQCVVLQGWGEVADLPTAHHFCGESCATKFVSLNLSRLVA